MWMRALGFVLLIGFTATAFAQTDRTFIVAAKSDQEWVIRGYASFDRQCRRDGVPQIVLAQNPAHGEIAMREGVTKIEAVSGTDTQCFGLQVEGLNVYYTPAPAYQGEDQLVLDVTFRNGSRRRDTVHVTVR